VRVVVTVGAGGETKKEEGSGTPVVKEEKGGNPDCPPDSVTVALPPPLVKLAGTDIQVFCSGKPGFYPSRVVQPAVVT
jgi:hypothetical protein